MIDRNLPEPERRECLRCSRPCTTRDGALYHWPSVDAPNRAFVLTNGMYAAPFSHWIYFCRWHRAAETRRKKRQEASR